MGINAKLGEIELVVTWVCNWHCPYCAVDTHSRANLSLADVMDKISLIPDGSRVTLSGGEVGTMQRIHIQQIIQTLSDKQCELSLNTNGLFLKRYPDLVSTFAEVLYHCSENLDPAKIPKYDYPNVEYMIIVTDRNIKNLPAFLHINSDITFHIVASTLPKGIDGDILSNANRYHVVTTHHNRMTTESKIRMFKEKDFDAIAYL